MPFLWLLCCCCRKRYKNVKGTVKENRQAAAAAPGMAASTLPLSNVGWGRTGSSWREKNGLTATCLAMHPSLSGKEGALSPSPLSLPILQGAGMAWQEEKSSLRKNSSTHCLPGSSSWHNGGGVPPPATLVPSSPFLHTWDRHTQHGMVYSSPPRLGVVFSVSVPQQHN